MGAPAGGGGTGILFRSATYREGDARASGEVEARRAYRKSNVVALVANAGLAALFLVGAVESRVFSLAVLAPYHISRATLAAYDIYLLDRVLPPSAVRTLSVVYSRRKLSAYVWCFLISAALSCLAAVAAFGILAAYASTGAIPALRPLVGVAFAAVGSGAVMVLAAAAPPVEDQDDFGTAVHAPVGQVDGAPVAVPVPDASAEDAEVMWGWELGVYVHAQLALAMRSSLTQLLLWTVVGTALAMAVALPAKLATITAVCDAVLCAAGAVLAVALQVRLVRDVRQTYLRTSWAQVLDRESLDDDVRRLIDEAFPECKPGETVERVESAVWLISPSSVGVAVRVVFRLHIAPKDLPTLSDWVSAKLRQRDGIAKVFLELVNLMAE